MNWHKKEKFIYDKLIPLSLFAIVGAFGWALRGTWGYGGMTGGYVAGFWWGLLFFYLAKIRGVDARWQAIAVTIGISFGGMNGYGQLLSWIRGNFNTGDGYLPINPSIGYIWLFIIGLEWGGTAAVIYSWTLTPKVEKRIWLLRIILPALGGLIGFLIVKLNPTIFFPHYSEELYNSATCSIQCTRTAATLPSLAMLLGIFIGLLLVEIAFVRNTLGFKSVLVMSISFAIAFPVAALWFFMDEIMGPWHWWKVWEESIGIIGGLSIGIVFLMLMHEREQSPLPNQANNDMGETKSTHQKDWNTHICFNLLILILLLMTASGMSVPGLILLGIEKTIDEMDYPPSRIIFIAIVGLCMLIGWLIHFVTTKKQHKSKESWANVPHLTHRFLLWNAYLTFVGLVGIGYDIMMYFYWGFFWAILAITLKYTSFLQASGVQT